MNINNLINEIKSNYDNDELAQIINELKLLLVKQESIVETECNCPHCNSTNFIKYGKRNEYQCYICKECKKTFTKKTNTITHYSKISKEIWESFIEYEFAGMTLKEESYFTHLSKTTCFHMRHRLYSICHKYMETIKMKGQTEIDASYTKINLKGTKPKNMPRLSKKRGNGSAFSGISHHKVCIIAATDENDNIFMRISGLGSESFEKYKKYSSTFKDSNLLVSDSKSSISQFSNHLGLKHDKIPVKPNQKRYTTDNGNSIQSLNEICKIVSNITHKYHGVNLRYLEEYISFNCLKKMLSYRFKRTEYYDELMKIIKDIKLKNTKPSIPVDLAEAYWEYNYGIYRH